MKCTAFCLLAVVAIAGCSQLVAADRIDETFNEWAAPRLLAEQPADPVERILQQAGIGEAGSAGAYGSPPAPEPEPAVAETPSPTPTTAPVTVASPGEVSSSPAPTGATSASATATASLVSLAAAVGLAALAL